MSISKPYYKNWAVDASGDIVPGAAVEVRRLYDGALATLYSTEGGAALANPLTAAADGSYEFYVSKEDAYTVEVGIDPSSSTHTVFLLAAGATFPTVSALDSAVTAGASWPDDTLITTPEVKFISSAGSAVTGLPSGLLPYDDVYPEHWGDNTTPGTTDMTTAVSRWFTYGDELTIKPRSYRISAGAITRANGDYSIRGAGGYISDFVTSDLTGDLFTLTSVTDNIFNIHWSGFRIRCDGGARTSGAFVRATAAVSRSSFSNMYIRNMYDGFHFEGCLNTRFEGILSDQFGIGSGKGRYAFHFADYNGADHPSGVYMSDMELSGLNGSSGSGLVAHVYFEAVDGFYLTNSHMFYADNCLRFNPDGSTGRNYCASVQVSNCYFDSTFLSHVAYFGTVVTARRYAQHRYSNCTFRDSQGAGGALSIAASVPLEVIQVANCRFSSNVADGIYTAAPCLAKDLMVSNTYFRDNNTGNAVGVGDISWRGAGGLINGTIHEAGGAAGHTIGLLSGSSNTVVRDHIRTNSTATGIVDNGTNNLVDSRVSSLGVTTTPQTILDVSADGLWEIFVKRAAGTGGAYALVVGDGTTPAIISQHSTGGSYAYTFSLSATDLQIALGTGSATSEIRIRRIS